MNDVYALIGAIIALIASWAAGVLAVGITLGATFGFAKITYHAVMSLIL